MCELKPWRVVTVFEGGGARIRCRHRTERTARWCRARRRLWRALTDPDGRYSYEVRIPLEDY